MACMRTRTRAPIGASRRHDVGYHLALLAGYAALTISLPESALADADSMEFVMPPVLQLQAASGLSNDDVHRIVARDSLMLSADEIALIDAALRNVEVAHNSMAAVGGISPGPDAARNNYRLDALLYFSPSSWSLWLNGRHVTPSSVPSEIRINAITPDYVEIVILADPVKPEDRRIFTLSPGQIYSAATGEVTDVTSFALNVPDLAPSAASLSAANTENSEAWEHARPEQLKLTHEQTRQLSDLKDALGSQN